MSMDIKPSGAQLSKIIPSGGFFGRNLDDMIGILDKKSITRPCCSLGSRCFA